LITKGESEKPILKRVGKFNSIKMSIHIQNAVYASPSKGVNCTSAVITLVNEGKTTITVLPDDLRIPDPDLGTQKGFTVSYFINGEPKYKGGIDGDKITLD
jgi:hypothetical protein